MNFITEFTKTVQKYPQKTAVFLDGKSVLSYQQLWDKSLLVAHHLKTNGLEAEDLVLLNLEKSPDYLVAILGVWMAGGAFVPLPPSTPAKRIQLIRDETKARFVLYQNQATVESKHCNLNLSELSVVEGVHNLLPCEDTSSLAYIIYTSGSTGQPKGVMVPHTGLLNVLEQQIDFFKITDKSRVLSYLSITFDAFVSDMGTTLLAGASFFIEAQSKLNLASNLSAVIERSQITHADLPPSLVQVIDVNTMADCLETVVIGGELCTDEAIKQWAKRLRLINVYGPTEVSICTSMVCCDSTTWHGPNIGKPLKNLTYQVLDDDQNPVCENKVGELYIGGVGLAKGYFNKPDLTAEKFVIIKGERFYKTNDLVQRRDRKYFFKGRTDRQLKLNGQLVCPEEIETVLKNHPQVEQAVVLPCKNTVESRQYLRAFIQSGAKGLSAETLESYLMSELPSWMMPADYVFLPKIPINTNQKIDYQSLKSYTATSISGKALGRSTLSVFEKTLLAAFQQVLQNPKVTTVDDFFALGGDSLGVLEVVMLLKSQGINLPIGLLGHKRTVGAIAQWYENQNDVSDGISVEVLKAETQLPPCLKQSLKKDIPESIADGIFLTGVTGFLGIHLLQEILQKSSSKVYVLVRAHDVCTALKRVQQTADFYKLELPDLSGRVVALCGDLSEEKFGLKTDDWDMLSAEVSAIYHCGAEVNMVKSFADLNPSNVLGVLEVIKLAATKTRKRIHYASTLSVFVATDQNTGRVLETDDLDDTKVIYGGYAQSKWVAEKLLHEARQNLEINIFRFGLLTPHVQTGVFAPHDFLYLFVKGLVDLGCLPDVDFKTLKVDVTPINYAADAMWYIAQNTVGGTFHIANKNTTSLQDLVSVVQKYQPSLQTLALSAWREMIEKRDLNDSERTAFLALCRSASLTEFEQQRSMDLFQATDIIFDQTQTQALLKPGGIVCPKAGAHLLEFYFSDYLQSI